jgi:deoxyribodipyrimidine photo-lyase
MGAQRRRFLHESLSALNEELGALGQKLLVVTGDPRHLIPRLVAQHGITRVGTSFTPGFYEQQQRQYLGRELPVEMLVHTGNTLLRQEQLPGVLAQLPEQFTPFRQSVEELPVDVPLPAPKALPPAPAGIRFALPDTPECLPDPGFPVRGGARAGRDRLRNFLHRQRAVDTYKETRDALSGQFYASGLSPWLANGCLSIRTVAHALLDYETTVNRNESTRWLYREFLWREFFHWRERLEGVRLFAPGKRGARQHFCTFDPRAYARWCQGDTDYPLVNALMRELVASGGMSNRGRQIAASCLVNELGLDWRYGAVFFEKHLVDFDLPSNYGNWRYIAGVGADPRGGRHFNLQKQAQLYDPDGVFTARWGGFRPPQPRFVTDAADWPLA